MTLTHGYVLDHGKVNGLKAGGGGRTQRRGFYPEHVELRLTDARRRTWELEGRALTTFPWQAWPGTVGHNCLLRWEVRGPDGAGGEGYGECHGLHRSAGARSAPYHRA